jgi:very-short-patch-repair endonuclease
MRIWWWRSIHKHTADEDADRQELLEARGLRVLRVTNEDVFSALDTVLERIRDAVTAADDDAD